MFPLSLENCSDFLSEESSNSSQPSYDVLPSAWGEETPHPAGSSQQLASCLEYPYNGSNAMDNFNFNLLPLQEALQISTCLSEFGPQIDEGVNKIPSTPITNEFKSQSTYPSPNSIDFDYSGAPSPPTEDTNEGMATTIPPQAGTHSNLYRAKVAKPRVLKANRDRRKKGGTRNGRLFVCEEPGCGSDFTSRQNLKNHLNAHYGRKLFSCEYCGKSFVTAHDCNRHIRNTCVVKRQNGIFQFCQYSVGPSGGA